MPNQHNDVIALIDQGAIPADKIDLALHATGVLPAGPAWRNFIDQLLLWLGALSLAFAVMFFVAYNWDSLGRFAQFALVQVLIVAAIALYLMQDSQQLQAKASLLVASILVGVLLALYGQTYQTGADPWQLFFTWALLIVPWVLIARFSALWLVWLALINTTLILYQDTFRIFGWVWFDNESATYLLLFVVNASALIIWELLFNRFNWLTERWPVWVLAVASGFAITALAIYSIFDSRDNYGLLWMTAMAALLYVYLKLRRDLFMLAGFCLSLITVTVLFFANHVLGDDADVGGFLLLSLITIGMGTATALWLRKLHREWQS